MAQMTKQDVENLVKEIAGEVVSDLRTEMEEASRKNTETLMSKIKESANNPAPQAKEEEKGNAAARYVRALAAAKGDIERAAKIAKERFKDERLHKALSESDFESGGAIVPDEYSAEIIELLRARTVVRSLGAFTVPMNSGSMTMPKQTSASTASYVGENKPIGKSEPGVGQLQLSAKKLAALVPISNDLIRDASPAADTLVREDMLSVMGLREDLAFLRDDGTSNKPKGLRHWAHASQVFARTQDGGSNTLATVTADLAKMVRLLEEGNVPMTRCGWVITPRTKWYLMAQRDANGNLVWQPEMKGGTLMGFPYRTTTQIPNNLGGGDETEIYFNDFSQSIIAENTQLIIEVFEGGAYYDGSEIVSGISNDQTIIRAIARHDFGVRHNTAVSVLTTVDWI